MLNRSANLAMSTSVLKALPGKLDIKRHSPSILYFYIHTSCMRTARALGSLRNCAGSSKPVLLYNAKSTNFNVSLGASFQELFNYSFLE